MKKFNVCVVLVMLFVCFSNASTNLLTNGSFEGPDISAAGYKSGFEVAPTGWLNWQPFFYLVSDSTGWGTAADGHQWLQTSDAGTAGSTNEAHAMILAPGQYTVTFNYTGNAGQAGTEGVLIRTFDMIDGVPQNMGDHVYTYAGENTAANPDWQTAQFILGVAPGATTTYLSILGQSYGAPEGTAMWIDNIRVEVPEPATFALLSMGVVSLFRKKTYC